MKPSASQFTPYLNSYYINRSDLCAMSLVVFRTDININFVSSKFGQVGVGDHVDHCSPVQVKFPLDQVLS